MRVEAAAVDRQRERALRLLAGAHAARADDALGRVEGEVRVRFVLRLGRGGSRRGRSALARGPRARHVLQLAVAVGGQVRQIERMVGDVQLHHAAAQLLQPLGVWSAPSCRARPAWCTRPDSPSCAAVLPRSRPGTGGTSRRPRAIRSRTASECRCRPRARRACTEVPAGTVTARAVDRQRDRHVAGARRRAVVGRVVTVGTASGAARGRTSSVACSVMRVARSLRESVRAPSAPGGRHAAQRAQRAVDHRVAQIAQQRDLRRRGRRWR